MPDLGAPSGVVAEYTSTSGTGAYILDGAVTNSEGGWYFRFADLYTDGELITYEAFNTAFKEVCLGTFSAGTNTLTRGVLARSTTGARISWPAQGRRIIRPLIGVADAIGAGGIDVINIDTGTTYTLNPIRRDTQLVWNSTDYADKTTYIEGSVPANKGILLDIKTTPGDGTAMCVIPDSGTIAGLRAIKFYDNISNLSLISNAAKSNWEVRCLCDFLPIPCEVPGDAVYFDGLRASLYTLSLDGVSDSPYLTFSYWVKVENADYNIVDLSYWGLVQPDGSHPGFYFTESHAASPILQLVDSSDTNFVRVNGHAVASSSGFVHVLGSIDASTNPITANIFHGETETTSDNISDAGPFDIGFSGKGFAIPNVEPPAKSNRVDTIRMLMGDFWFAPGVYLDFTDPDNRALFHDVTSTMGDTNPVSVDLNGATLSLSPGSFADGITTSHTLTGSLWIDEDTTEFNIFTTSPGVNFALTLGGGNFFIYVKDSATHTQQFDAFFPVDSITGLTNIRFAVDLDHAIGSKVVLAYVGTTDVTSLVTVDIDDQNNLLAGFTDTSIDLTITSGPLADFWFAPGQFFDPGSEFVDGTGAPVNIGANGELPSGTAPSVYFHVPTSGAASDFFTNRGTGGAFTIDMPSSPTLNGISVDVVVPKDLGVNGELPTGTAPAIFLTGDSAAFGINRGTGGPLLSTGVLDDSPIGLRTTIPAPDGSRGGIRVNGSGQMAANGSFVPDTTVGTFSFFLRMSSLPTMTVVIQSLGSNKCSIYLNPSGNISVSLGSGGSLRVLTQTSQSVSADSRYHHVAGSFSTSSGAFQLYIDRISATYSTSGSAGFTIDFSPSDSYVWLGTGGSSGYVGDIAEFWEDLTQEIDLSVSTNLDKFVTAGLASVSVGDDGSLPTGSTPTFYFSQTPRIYRAVTFFTNRANNTELYANDGGDIDFVSVAPGPYP